MFLPVTANVHFYQGHKHSVTLEAHLSPRCSLTVLRWRKNCVCSSKEGGFFCAEQWFCSSRTHLMPHWNPIITTMEQNELSLTWSAASWFRVAEGGGLLALSAVWSHIFLLGPGTISARTLWFLYVCLWKAAQNDLLSVCFVMLQAALKVYFISAAGKTSHWAAVSFINVIRDGERLTCSDIIK